jgi:hypothetical protein
MIETKSKSMLRVFLCFGEANLFNHVPKITVYSRLSIYSKSYCIAYNQKKFMQIGDNYRLAANYTTFTAYTEINFKQIIP